MKYFKLSSQHPLGHYITYWKWDNLRTILSVIEQRKDSFSQEYVISSSYAYDETALDSIFNYEEITEEDWDLVRLNAVEFVKDKM